MSCASATSCTAVGEHWSWSGDHSTLVEAWNGTAWFIQPTPEIPDASESYFTSVSCVSATDCVAVGYYKSTTKKKYFTLAEVWDGTAWSEQATPNPKGAF